MFINAKEGWHDPEGRGDPPLDRGKPPDHPAGAGRPGRHHPGIGGGAYLQSHEKREDHRPGLRPAPAAVCYRHRRRQHRHQRHPFFGAESPRFQPGAFHLVPGRGGAQHRRKPQPPGGGGGADHRPGGRLPRPANPRELPPGGDEPGPHPDPSGAADLHLSVPQRPKRRYAAGGVGYGDLLPPDPPVPVR